MTEDSSPRRPDAGWKWLLWAVVMIALAGDSGWRSGGAAGAVVNVVEFFAFYAAVIGSIWLVETKIAVRARLWGRIAQTCLLLGLVALGVAWSSSTHQASADGFSAYALRNMPPLLALGAVLGVIAWLVETRLSGRVRLMAWVAEISVLIGAIVFGISLASGGQTLLLAGAFWAFVTGALILWVALRREVTT